MSLPRRLVIQVTSLGVLLGIAWWYAGTHESFAVASVPDILKSFREAWLFEKVSSDVVPTLKRLLGGYALSVLIAVPLGLCLGASRWLRMFTGPVFTFFRSVPPIALIPAAIIIFGIGEMTKTIIIVSVCVWPITLNTADGVAELDRTLVDTGRSYKFSPLEQLRYVILPAVAPRIFAGMQTSLGLAVILTVASEYLAASDGIGYFLFQAQSTYSTADMWAAIILLAIIGYLINLAFVAIQRRVLFWHADDSDLRS